MESLQQVTIRMDVVSGEPEVFQIIVDHLGAFLAEHPVLQEHVVMARIKEFEPEGE